MKDEACILVCLIHHREETIQSCDGIYQLFKESLQGAIHP